MLHNGHKKRLREKAYTNIESLQPHEIIELILNFSIVRKNTNPIAHELINKFGSVSNVLDADIASLMQVEGVGEVSAGLLHLIPKLCNIYNKSRTASYSKITNLAEAKEFFRVLFSCIDQEEAYVLCLNKVGKIITNIKLGEGDIEKIDISTKDAIAKIVSYLPYSVYIAHNHVNTRAYPSDADIRFTKVLQKSLQALNIRLLDHIIISKDEAFSFATAELIDDIIN